MTNLNTEQMRMYQENIRLAYWVAYRYGHSVMPLLDDRIQAARIGLMHAVQHFDPAQSRLSTYAIPAMQHAILRCGLDERPICLEGPPTPTDTACTMRKWHRGPIRDSIFAEELIDMLPVDEASPEDALIQQEERARLFEAARRVPPLRERTKVTPRQRVAMQKLRRWGWSIRMLTQMRQRFTSTWTVLDVITKLDQGLSQSEIAQELGLSRERIRQVVAQVRQEYLKMGGGR